MAKLLSTIIDGFISSKQFVSGLLGSGWKIWKENDRYKAEFDDLVIRNTMTVFELLISKIRAIKGAMSITQGSGKISGIREDDTNYYITIDEEMSFVADDFIRYMEFNGSKREYWVKVSSVNGSEITVAKNEFAEVAPLVGDELVQFGNATDARRQSAIYLHADENGEPAIDVLDGINGKSLEGKTKLRVGGLDGITDADFPDGINGFGIYSQNGFFKGVIAGAGGYLLRADGTGYIANGSIWWDKEKKVHFENEVVLQWENLSDETKNQLKGDSVFVAYHAGEEEPEKPTGDGTTEGWTIASDADTVWMSQKVSYERDAGEWGNPIRIKGTNANLLPWIQEWTRESTYIGDDMVISPRMFSGKRDETTGKLTGVAFGRNVVTIVGDGVAKQKSGIFGIKDDVIMFEINAEDGSAMYRGPMNVNDKFKIETDGSMTATLGHIGGFTIGETFLESGGLKLSGGSIDYATTFIESHLGARYEVDSNLVTSLYIKNDIPSTSIRRVCAVYKRGDITILIGTDYYAIESEGPIDVGNKSSTSYVNGMVCMPDIQAQPAGEILKRTKHVVIDPDTGQLYYSV